MRHWSVTSSNFCDPKATYLSWQYNFHGPEGLCAIIEFVEYEGSPELWVRAAANVPVYREEMEIVHHDDEEAV